MVLSFNRLQARGLAFRNPDSRCLASHYSHAAVYKACLPHVAAVAPESSGLSTKHALGMRSSEVCVSILYLSCILTLLDLLHLLWLVPASGLR